jgi:hypothetical protein
LLRIVLSNQYLSFGCVFLKRTSSKEAKCGGIRTPKAANLSKLIAINIQAKLSDLNH